MGVWDFDSLASHLGHCIDVVCYGGTDGPNRNVAIECVDCGCVLLDFDEYPEDEDPDQREEELADIEALTQSNLKFSKQVKELEAKAAQRDSELATVRDWAHKLQARVNELRQEIEREKAHAFKLAAGVCIVAGGLVGDEGGTPYCTVQRELAQFKLQLQQQEACTSWTNDFRVEAEKHIAELEAEAEQLKLEVEHWKRKYQEKIYHN